MTVTLEMAKELNEMLDVACGGKDMFPSAAAQRIALSAWCRKFGLEPREPDADDDAAVELHKILESPMLTHQRIVEAALLRCFLLAAEFDAEGLSNSILGIRALLADLGVLKVKA